MKKRATRIAALILSVLVAGLLAPGAARHATSAGAAAVMALPTTPGAPDYGPLESMVRAYVARDAATWSVYFVDLDSGQAFGINPNAPIPQASLVKVPLVLYVNHLVSQGKTSWDDRIAYRPESDYRSGAGALQFFTQPGWTYSVRALSNLAITLSDNIAKAMLVRHVGSGNLVRYMSSLGAAQPHANGEEATTARDMAIYLQAILRMSREEPELGQRLIDDMSHTIWHVGIPGRLPEGVRVAHKEGDITGVANDAGIVFAGHPYIICILSTGQPDVDAGFRKIAEISEMVYSYQERVYGGI